MGAERKGIGMNIVTGLIITLLVGGILILILVKDAGGKYDILANIAIDSANERFYGKDCVEVADESFKSGKEYDFEVDFGDIEVKNIRHFGFLMECGGIVSRAKHWFEGVEIEEWMITCVDSDGTDVELFDSASEVGAACGFLKGAPIQFLESNGYETEIECDNKVNVHIKIKDKLFAGTSANLYLCYVAHK